MVRALLDVYGEGPSEELEVSMEMDPGTFDAPRLQGFVQGAGGWLTGLSNPCHNKYISIIYIIYLYLYLWKVSHVCSDGALMIHQTFWSSTRWPVSESGAVRRREPCEHGGTVLRCITAQGLWAGT